MIPTIRRWASLLSMTAIGLAVAAGAADAKDAPLPIAIAKQGNFFVLGKYVSAKDTQIMTGQMYVQYQIPAHKTHPYPIIMVHGGGQTGEGWWETPDGREGWATLFLRQGYAVYVVDDAGRGRSGYFTDAYGPTRRPNTAAMMQRFSVPQDTMLYPQAKLDTQWPGTGKVGDPVFDQFFANQVEDMTDLGRNETLTRTAIDTLLDKIGPSILLTHSQSGPIGWGIADDRPSKLKALIAIESSGPPFHELIEKGAPDWFGYEDKITRSYGVTATPLTYAPAVQSADDLKPELQKKADAPDLAQCWLQAEPARQLVNLAKVKILMVGSAASYHVPYDHCTSEYLTQAGVKHAFVRLPSVGIQGNGHFMMIEKNSAVIARYLAGWMAKNVH